MNQKGKVKQQQVDFTLEQLQYLILMLDVRAVSSDSFDRKNCVETIIFHVNKRLTLETLYDMNTNP